MSGICNPGRRGMVTKNIASQIALATAVVVGTAMTQAYAFDQNVSWLVQFDRTRGQHPKALQSTRLAISLSHSRQSTRS